MKTFFTFYTIKFEFKSRNGFQNDFSENKRIKWMLLEYFRFLRGLRMKHRGPAMSWRAMLYCWATV